MTRAEFRATLILIAITLGYLLLSPSPSQPSMPPQVDLHTESALIHEATPDVIEAQPGDAPGAERRAPVRYRKQMQESSRQTARKKKRPTTARGIRPCQPFDPNTVHGDSLIAWGVRTWVVNNLVKYRDRGGSFRRTQDVAKIYGIDSLTLQKLTMCMQFPAQTKPLPTITKLCINSATVQEWQSLRGIGPVLAQRIVNFRSALGGFLSVDQVKDTYGLSDETFDGIRSHLTISHAPQRLAINDATVEELASHPYLSHRDARTIRNFIQQHGRVDSLNALYGIHALTPALIDKIAPYLSFETQAVALSEK